MRFKQYQAGGAIYTPFISSRGASQGQVNPSVTTSTSSSKSEKADNKIRDEIVKVLQESGINNDVDSFLQVANDFLIRSQNLSNASLFGGSDNSYSISDLTYILSLANRVKQNKLQWDAAATNLKTQNNSNEVAVASNGYLYVRSEEGFTTISPEEFANNRDKYDALTNSQVLGLRQKLPGLAFNTDILNDMAGAISLETIQKHLLDTIDKFNETTRSEYVKRTGDNVSQSAWNGMRILIDQGPEGYYKVTNKTDLVNVESALDYLWKSLGADGQKRLRAEVAISGGDPNKNRYDLIAQMLEHHTSFTQDPSFDSAATKSVSDDGGGTVKTEKLERLAAFAMGKGETEEIWIVPRASEIGQRGAGKVKAMNFGNMVDKNDNTLPTMSVASLRSQAEYFKAAFNQDVTFGGQIINSADENAILWDGTSQVSQVWLPYTRTENGQITPDFDLFFRYMDFINELDDNPNRPATEISKLVTKYKLNGKLNPNNILELSDTMCFMTFSAYAHDDAIKFTEATKRMTEEVSRQEGARIAQIYENASRYGTTTPGKNHKQLYNFDKLQIWDKNDFRKGNVFIPIKSSFLGTYSSMKEIIPESKVNNFHHRSTLANGQPVVSGQFKE